MTGIDIFIFLLSFLVFVFIQGLFINGVYNCFKKDMVFYPLAEYLQRVIKNEWILKPVFGCLMCMSSLWGTVSYWLSVYPLFGITKIVVLFYFFDVFILVAINQTIWKRL